MTSTQWLWLHLPEVLFATELSSVLRERATSNQRQLPGSEAGAHET